MICYACGKQLTDKEIQSSSIEDFIENKVLCNEDNRISNELVNQQRDTQ